LLMEESLPIIESDIMDHDISTFSPTETLGPIMAFLILPI